MKRKNIKFIENEAFDKNINIELCNALINFIAETSSNKSKDVLKEIEKKCIWFKKSEESNLQDICEVQYFGELLERYKEKIDNNIRNVRAISLALGYAKDLIDTNMIIGTQLIDFISEIKSMSDNDIYIQGALYLFDSQKYNKYEERLLFKIKYTNTEDVIFVLSLFDYIKDPFEILKEQVIYLLSKERTISAINNIKLYAWLINNLYEIIKGERRKDIELLKALILIPTKQIKRTDKVYIKLCENGYTREEIAYLNYGLLYYTNIPNTVRMGNSITEERIAIEFCKIILSDTNTQSESLYELIKDMIKEYRRFDIKCNGNSELKEAIKDEINIVNPITFIEFREIFCGKIYSFNILDSKWDIIAEKLENTVYKNIFDEFIGYNDFDREKLEKCISRYNEITNTSYLESFYLYRYSRENIFRQLVNKNVISLNEYYDTYEKMDKTNEISISHIKEYISGIHYKNAFLFIKYILEDRKYSINQIKNLGFELDRMYERRYSYNTEDSINVKKDFLSKEEQQKLLLWLDEYMFNVEPERYIKFAKAMLDSKSIQEIVDRESLRYIYLMISRIDENIAKDDVLREKYLTEQELQDIREKEKKEKEQKETARLEKQQIEIVNNFEKNPKQNFKQIYDFCYGYRWNDEEWDICSKIVKKYLYENIEKFTVSKEEIINLMELSELLLCKETINIEEFKVYIIRYLEREEIIDGNIKRAC